MKFLLQEQAVPDAAPRNITFAPAWLANGPDVKRNESGLDESNGRGIPPNIKEKGKDQE